MASIPGRKNRAGGPVVRVVPPVEDDAALIAAVRSRASGAATRLWDRYAGLSRRILARTLGPTTEVEDAVQIVFLRLFRDLPSLREPSALRSFVIGITLHVASSELRRRRARRWLFLTDDGVLPEPEAKTDREAFEHRQALLALYRILDQLDVNRRIVFVLRYVEGLELGEISTVLGCSLATTKRRVAESAERVSRLAARDPRLKPYVRTP